MKADQGFDSLAKRAHYLYSITDEHLSKKKWMGSIKNLYCVSYLYFTPSILILKFRLVASPLVPAETYFFSTIVEWKFHFLSLK